MNINHRVTLRGLCLNFKGKVGMMRIEQGLFGRYSIMDRIPHRPHLNSRISNCFVGADIDTYELDRDLRLLTSNNINECFLCYWRRQKFDQTSLTEKNRLGITINGLVWDGSMCTSFCPTNSLLDFSVRSTS